MPVQNAQHIRSWPSFPLALAQTVRAPAKLGEPAPTRPAATRASVKVFNSSAPHTPTAQSPSGMHTPDAHRAGVRTPTMLRASSWQRLQTLLRTHLALTQGPCPIKLGGRPPTPQERAFIDEVYTEARRIAGAADTATSLMHAARIFDADTKRKQQAVKLHHPMLSKGVRQAAMAVFFERLSRLHGMCDHNELASFVALCEQWCGTPPPAPFAALIWLQYMRYHAPGSSAAAIAHLNTLDACLGHPLDKTPSPQHMWMPHEDTLAAIERLNACFATYKDMCAAKSDAPLFAHHSQKLGRRIASSEAGIRAMTAAYTV